MLDSPRLLPPLVRAGPLTVNLLYLISHQEVDWPEPGRVDVTVFPGRTVRLEGPEAAEWRAGLESYAPPPPSGRAGGPVAGARVASRRKPVAGEEGQAGG